MESEAAKVEVQPWMKEAAAEYLAGLARCPVCLWPLTKSAEDGCVIGNCSMRPSGEYEQGQLRNRRIEWQKLAEIISRHAPAPDLTIHLTKYRDAMDAIYNDSEAGRELVTKHFGLTHPVVEPDAPAPEADEDDKFDKIFASLELRTHKLLDQYGVPKNSKGFPDVYDGLHCRLEQHFQSAPAPEWEQDTDPNPELPPNPPVITIAGGKESDGSEQKKSGTDHAPGHFAYWVSGPIWVIVLFVLLYFAWRPLMRHGKIWFVESSTSAGELHQFCSKRVRVTFDAPGAKVGDFAVFSRTSAGTLHDIGRMPLENEPNYEIASVNGTQGEICSMIWN